MRNMARGCMEYFNRVYDLKQKLCSVVDGRINPSIPIYCVLLSLFLGFLTRVPSFRRLESRNRHQFKKVLESSPSADTLGYALMFCGIDPLRSTVVDIVNRARYNKVFEGGTVEGYTVCALDGSEIYCTEVPQDESGWKSRELENGNKQWYMSAVLLSYVGDGPPLVLDIDRINPGEGETTAALRVLRRAREYYWDFCDIVTLDSLYAKAPVIHEILDQGKEVVVRVKQENYEIIKDIEGMVQDEPPDEVYEDIKVKEDAEYSRYRYDLKIWDRDGLESWESVRKPLRCLKIEEVKKEVVRGEVVEEERKIMYLVTTCEKGVVPALTIWRIAHIRWDLENSNINDLKNNWHLDHCFIHDPHAVLALWLIVVIAFNLFLLFFHRNLRHPGLKKEGMSAVAELIFSHINTIESLAPT